MIRITFFALLILTAVISCVPKKQFLELQEKNNVCMRDRDSLKSVNESLTVKGTEMQSKIELMGKRIEKLTASLSDMQDSAAYYLKNFNQYRGLYTDLLSRQDAIVKGNEKEMKNLLVELNTTKNELLQQEDRLHELEQTLIMRKKNLDELKSELELRDQRLQTLDSTLKIQQKELEDRNAKLVELQSVLAAKDSAVMALKSKVTAALMGFENSDLTIHMKNGKLYVSLQEKLLFKFGSTEIDPKGINALKKLSQVLEQNTDINIMIEGHTDDVGDMFYNWELSTKRANAVVKIILKNSKIDPSRLTAAGRGQFLPVDPAKTDAARAKNRRTEIILTPKLDELFKILETN